MTNEQIRVVAYLYLLGLMIDLIWYVCKIGGVSGFKTMIREIADEVKVKDGLVLAVAVPITVLLIAAWPVSMHLDMMKGDKK